MRLVSEQDVLRLEVTVDQLDLDQMLQTSQRLVSNSS